MTLTKIKKSKKSLKISLYHWRTVWKIGSHAKYIIFLKYRDYYYHTNNICLTPYRNRSICADQLQLLILMIVLSKFVHLVAQVQDESKNKIHQTHADQLCGYCEDDLSLAAGSIFLFGTSFREDLVMKIFLRPFFLFC